MNVKQILGDSPSNIPKIHADPFTLEKLTSILIFIRKSTWGRTKGTWECEATIEFQNNNTRGTHKLEAEDFPSLYSKIKEFLETV